MLGRTVLAHAGPYAPGIAAARRAQQVITPRDLESTYGLTGGHILHGEPSLDQLFTMRPVLGWAQYRTPIAGLYLCGAGTHPGGGITGGSGQNAAREILEGLEAMTARCRRRLEQRSRSRGLASPRPGTRPATCRLSASPRGTPPSQQRARAALLALPVGRSHPGCAPFPHRRPHMAGSARDRELAEWTRDRFAEAGLEDVAIRRTRCCCRGRSRSASR